METIDLHFPPDITSDALSLSGAAATGDHLFVAPDEGTAIVRLRRLGPGGGYGQATPFEIAHLLGINVNPAAKPKLEFDLEGMDVADGSLWLAGSHGAVRKRVKDEMQDDEVLNALERITAAPERRLLARIPLVADPNGPTPVPLPDPASGLPPAACLPSEGPDSLVAALRQDRHLGPFMGLPSKDNGFDVEGLAVVGPRLFLGLRGPVLRSWAVILEIEPVASPANPAELRLALIDGDGGPAPFRKHFLDLDGLGIRDLAREGDDLLILAGPTMVLDGPSWIRRVPGGARDPLPTVLRKATKAERVARLRVGVAQEHPEAITALGGDPPGRLLVLYDSPARTRRLPDGVRGSVVQVA